MPAPQELDAFILHRRDGAVLADHLARALRRYRLPASVARRLGDRGQAVAPLRVHRPAPGVRGEAPASVDVLRASRHLVVVASPSVAACEATGEPNVVERATKDYLRLHHGRGLCAVHARGERRPALPGVLGPHPRLEVIDLGVPACWRHVWAPAAARARWAIHRVAAQLYDVPHDLMPRLAQAARRAEGVRRVGRAAAALLLVAGVLAVLTHGTQQRGRDAEAWVAKAAAAREAGRRDVGAQAVLAALALRPESGRAWAERFAWPAEADPAGAWRTLPDTGRVALGLAVRADDADAAAGLGVEVAEPAERGAWVAVVEGDQGAVRPLAGGSDLLRFALPPGERLERVALHLGTRRCWVATRDEHVGAGTLPLGRVYVLREGAAALERIARERSVATSLCLSRDGRRVVWALATGLVRAARLDTTELEPRDLVAIGPGAAAQAGFVGATGRIAVVDGAGGIHRETQAGSAVLAPVAKVEVAHAPPAVAFHPRAGLVAVVAGADVVLVALDDAAEDPPAPLVVAHGATVPVARATFTPDGTRLVLEDARGLVCLLGPTGATLRAAAAR